MTTIDKLDISVHNNYAIRTMLIEQINQQLHLEQAASIPPQTQMVNMNIQWTELSLLLGVVALHTPWAHFYPPRRFFEHRRSPFAFWRILPTFGSLEEQAEDLSTIQSVICKNPEQEKEKQAMIGCMKMLEKINDWMSHIVGRIGQFLQG